MSTVPATVYTGPQCPRCSFPLRPEAIQTGSILCPHCDRLFEATVFTPPARKAVGVIAEVVGIGPEGTNACANHARNAATASCQRCGLFICALCDMNVGTGSYCPACFERVRTEGTLQAAARRYRDYASMARTSVIVGLFFSILFFGLPFGAAGIYFSIRGRRQRREEGRSGAGMTALLIVAILEVLGGIAAIGVIIYAMLESS